MTPIQFLTASFSPLKFHGHKVSVVSISTLVLLTPIRMAHSPMATVFQCFSSLQLQALSHSSYSFKGLWIRFIAGTAAFIMLFSHCCGKINDRRNVRNEAIRARGFSPSLKRKQQEWMEGEFLTSSVRKQRVCTRNDPEYNSQWPAYVHQLGTTS